MKQEKMFVPSQTSIKNAATLLRTIVKETPLELNLNLSAKYRANVYLKREDLTPVRSYKIRGAFVKMNTLASSLPPIVTCSAGNHAQGVAFSCDRLGVQGEIFMPSITPNQKINKVKQFGKKFVNINLVGKNFDECFQVATQFAQNEGRTFVHPFDDEMVITGQATVGYEIFEQFHGKQIDYILVPVGGGGLAAGLSSYIREVSPLTKIIGVEPTGAPSMTLSLRKNTVSSLEKLDTFVDGAAVKKVGALNFPICKENLDDMILVDEGHVCSKIVQMYNESGYIIEPAGVLSLCALDKIKYFEGANIVSVISGGNSDVFRMPEILERSLIYEGVKHYFRIEFPQKAGALKKFIMSALGPNDDIIYFRYTKLIAKETGPVVIGIETTTKENIVELLTKMRDHGIVFEKLDPSCVY